MKSIAETVDVLVAGGGTAGHVAAIQAARAGAGTSVIEADSMLGGTMTYGGVFMPNHFYSTKEDFRALIPKGSSRILVAGRIVSSEKVAFAGIRAQCTCMAMGQAMGAAAALAIHRKLPSRQIPAADIVALTVEHGAVKL